MSRALSVVKPGEKPPAKKRASRKPTTIKAAAEQSERDLLVALRTHLAQEMDKGAVPAHALASVSAKIREYDREIRAIDSRDEQEAEQRGPSDDEAWQAI